MSANGEMLRLARQRRALQQQEAAKQLGVEQPILSRLENGMLEVREDVIARASKIYDFPPSFFYLNDTIYGAPVSVHPMWRKKADVSARDVDAIIAELNIRVIHMRRLLEGVEVGFSNSLPRLDIEDYGSPQRIAALLRAHWQLPKGPLKDLTANAERSGVVVVHSDLSGASVSGVTFATPGMPPLVVLNSAQPADRMRFTLAHEIGHLVMHRFPTPSMEEEANLFASELLLPEADIKSYFVGRKIDLPMIAALKPEWRVSMGALIMAADKHGFLSAHQKQYLWKQMSARGYRTKEPPELDFPREMPTVNRDLLKVHRESLGYSDVELSQLLHVHQHEIDNLFQIEARPTTKARLTIIK